MKITGYRFASSAAPLLGVLMISSGAIKLVGGAQQVALFAALGLPGWFRALVGSFEVLGGFLMIVPYTVPAGSLVIGTILVGALWAHVAFGEWTHLVPVIGLLALLSAIFKATRVRAVALIGAI